MRLLSIPLIAMLVWAAGPVAKTGAASPAPPSLSAARSGADVIVVYNKKVAGSKGVARHYARVRGVPSSNLVAVSLPDNEWMQRRHMAKLLGPVKKRRAALLKAGRHPLVLLTYGIPLRVVGKDPAAKNFHERVATGKKRARATAETAVIDVARATGITPSNLSAMGDKQLIRYGRERAMSAASQLSLAMKSDAMAAQVWTLRQALIKVTGDSRGKAADAYALALRFRGIASSALESMAERTRASGGALAELAFWLGLERVDPNNKADAAVDSELALGLGGPFQIAVRLPNPWLPVYDNIPGIDAIRRTITPVVRLDAPTPALAKRLVDDAVAVEADGLSGTAYIDARGLEDSGDPYADFDQSLRRAAHVLEDYMPVVLDEQETLFSAGSAPNAALYAGWYAMGRYTPAFVWKRGAVGYHAASIEAEGLHQIAGDQWVKRMIEAGVAATLGPVMEPFLDSFPPPDRFFLLLLEGESLMTAYYRTIPHLSWRQVVIGDPLYHPFK